ncbi:MAG: hypothetical protein R3213_04035 [Flavobacteriaceae bacterium]|nr:hypothetical protein [Flavobacteriaceae bacterium]
MNTTNLKLTPILLLWTSVLIFSCKNEPETEATEEMVEEIEMEMEMEEESMDTPQTVLIIDHNVANYDTWKQGFDDHSEARANAGLKEVAVMQNKDNKNDVKVVLGVTDMDMAKAFTTNPDLKNAMTSAGVQGAPTFTYWTTVRGAGLPQSSKDRAIIIHEVKDFDEWIKHYDAEGEATRNAEGMEDRVIARNVENPNLIQIVFEINDLEKAKKAINSEGKKKIMMDAGVIGQPTIKYYSITTL